MNNSKLTLLNQPSDYAFFIIALLLLFSLSIFKHYQNYTVFTHNEITPVEAMVQNIYEKDEYNVIKFSTDTFTAFTSVSKHKQLQQLDTVKLYLISKQVSFFEYLKGFYTSNIKLYKLEAIKEKRAFVMQHIHTQHNSSSMKELFGALFLALPISKELREVCANYGISHLIAISGFHLGLISLFLYALLYFPYGYVHQRFFPFRNRKLDIALITSVVLLSYLIFTDMVPSLLRAFVMFVLALIFLRSNIKLLSYMTLLLTLLLILSVFPEYLFSLALWFSVAGVFYIFLFMQYFSSLPKTVQFILFNAWIFLAMNPITHAFFGATSFLQLFSPFITVAFTLFYPLVALLHLIGQGDLLDGVLQWSFSIEPHAYMVMTPWWFLMLYVLVSFAAIKSRTLFMALNILMLGFNSWLFY
ncbi:ComEC/Rec2 family competence protein [Candidatus Marinarcus aquaticus]|uniref:Competence protein n=1 Tax=Candidatus Marinarcus aquaticus TaxID=2044504 RepID=A0A4Q0XRL6_9BACT|nr:ComEC/Rec2 family competence protein [Candidatus Marinarcus aquaticus]RXJ60137.1 competence protein [Candidatus Marinarcus aquaticus]